MKLPGEAILEFKIRSLPDGSTALVDLPFFTPRFGGILYWYVLYPFHRLLYPNLLKAIRRLSENPLFKALSALRGL